MSEDWWQALLEGSVGAFLGTLASIFVALYAIRRQTRMERELAVDDQRNAACLTLLSVTHEMHQRVVRLSHLYEEPRDRATEFAFIYSQVQYALPLATFISQRLQELFLELREHVFILGEEFVGLSGGDPQSDYVLEVIGALEDCMVETRKFMEDRRTAAG